MGYQALLFCPDEKTARTVTQVLSELEFSVESCIEPFAAVKKLMGQHFDAVVVDCDNEQNATLLFKSARNSTSNQASLAVAVVEGQAGVAKAFRIGANLVLTKPINIEQAKGTLRVARGLLRKGEPAKAGAVAPPTSFPAKPAAARSVPPLKSAAPPAPSAASTPLPAAPLTVKPPATQAWPATVAATSAPVPAPAPNDDDLLDIGADDPIATPSAAAIVESAFGKIVSPDLPSAKLSVGSASPAAEGKSAFDSGLSAKHSSGAASAPAPAREPQASHVAEISPVQALAPAKPLFDQPAEAARSESSNYVGPAPSFTFGGANVPDKPTGASKKIILGAAAAAIVAAGIYVGWTKFQGRANQSNDTQTQSTSAPVEVPQTAKPSVNQAAPVTPKPLVSIPTNSAPSSISHLDPAPTKSPDASNPDAAFDDVTVTIPGKVTSSTGPAVAAPLVLKAGKVPAVHAKPSAPDAPAPSMIGIANAGADAPPLDLGSGAGSAPQPVLQTLNVSQGVSQGLLLKKVQPTYPRNALSMRIEGSVELTATISKTGDISRVKVLSGDSQLTRAAADAVKQWKYKPYLLNGEPVEIQTQVTINFRLPK